MTELETILLKSLDELERGLLDSFAEQKRQVEYLDGRMKELQHVLEALLDSLKESKR